MTTSPRFVCQIRSVLPATLEAIEKFLAEVRCHAQRALPQTECFAAELLVREALTNAVVHGCGSDPRKHVSCILRLRARRMIIAVYDEGEGFDWRAAWKRRSATSAATGRGIQILRQFAVRVRYNAKGNAVTMIKQWEEG